MTEEDRNSREAEKNDERDLRSLVRWLEYGRTSGFMAARCSEKQEWHWADLLKRLLEDRA